MRRSTVCLLAVAAILTIGADECPPPPDNIINVETTEPGIVEDGLCSLAEAITTANDGEAHPDCEYLSESGQFRIVLGSRQTYTLTEPYDEEYGLPEITGSMLIYGRNSVIERADEAPEFGILLNTGTLELEDVTIRNAARNPGVSTNNALTLRHSKISGCDVGIKIFISTYSTSLHVIGSTIQGNQTGIVNECSWPVFGHFLITVDSTTISRNRPGGGVVFDGCGEGSIFTVTNSTFSSNAAHQGGAVSVVDGDLLVEHCTIVNNIGYSEGGGIYAESSVVNVSRSIVAQNQGLNCSITDDSTIYSGGHNITDDDWCQLDANSDLRVADPMLSELDFWGGPTLTHIPLEGSPAIDMVEWYCSNRDQRDYVRPADGDGDGVAACDCGAVEFGAEPPIYVHGDPVDQRPYPSFN